MLKQATGAVVVVVGLLSVLAGQVYGQESGSGMVGYWKLDDTGAPTTDSSGNLFNGTWTGTVSALTGAANTPQATPFSTGCLSFGSANAQVSVPGNGTLSLTGDFTVAFWMYPTADGTDYQRLVGKGNFNDRTFGVWRNPNGDHRILFQQYSAPATAAININSVASPATNQWTHVACRISGFGTATVTGKIFIDGDSATKGASTPRPNTPVAVADPVTFGYAGFHTSFPGRLDDIRLYDRALSDAEIQALAAGNRGPAAPVLSSTPGPTSTTLTWTGTATVCNVKRSSTTGGSYTTIASNVAASPYTDNATGYYYVVSGVTYGEGPDSNEVAPPITALPNTGLFTNETPTSTQFTIKFNQAVLAGD